MPAVSRRFVINESQIKKFTLAGGSVHGATRRLAEATDRTAVFIAPRRTGALATTISNGEYWSNGRSTKFTVSVGAYYAKWVLEGFKGYIYPKHLARNRKGNKAGKRAGTFSGRPPMFPVGKSQGEPQAAWTFAPRVKGQSANNFLMRALRIAMKVQGYQ